MLFALQPLHTVHLGSHDTFSGNDVFVKVRYASMTHHTQTIHNVNNPTFLSHEIMLFPIVPDVHDITVTVHEADFSRHAVLEEFSLDVRQLDADFTDERESDHLVFKVARVEILPERTHLTLVETAVSLEETRDELEEARRERGRIRTVAADLERSRSVLEETCRMYRAQIERLTDLVHEMESEKTRARQELSRQQMQVRESYDTLLSILQDTTI